MIHGIRARNSAADSENRIHSDEVARDYGFRGGLVPGVAVFGYMVGPVLESLGLEWLDHGSMDIRLLKPVFEGDELLIHFTNSGPGCEVVAERRPDTICAVSQVGMGGPGTMALAGAGTESGVSDTRPEASEETMRPGTVLRTFRTTLEPTALSKSLATMPARLRCAAHPAVMLELSNRILMRSYRLDPWLHVGSELTNHAVAEWGDCVEVQGVVQERFERKGHEFVVILVQVSRGERVLQTVRHKAIYRLRRESAASA